MKRYTIDCSFFICSNCSLPDDRREKNICEFEGTKKQVKAFIKKHWKQPKIKEVK